MEYHKMERVRVDIEGYTILRCPTCGYEVGLRHDGKKTIREGNESAGHSFNPPLDNDGGGVRVGEVATQKADSHAMFVH